MREFMRLSAVGAVYFLRLRATALALRGPPTMLKRRHRGRSFFKAGTWPSNSSTSDRRRHQTSRSSDCNESVPAGKLGWMRTQSGKQLKSAALRNNSKSANGPHDPTWCAFCYLRIAPSERHMRKDGHTYHEACYRKVQAKGRNGRH